MVLCVDDDAHGQALASCFFMHRDFHVMEAKGGDETVRKVLVLRPQLIIMDLQVRMLNPHETTQRLKSDRRTRAIPLIALSTDIFPHRRQDAELAGCDAFLVKPVRFEHLLGVAAPLITGRPRRTGTA
ncbi:MAG: response regulator [Polyangiaceae bacterium]